MEDITINKRLHELITEVLDEENIDTFISTYFSGSKNKIIKKNSSYSGKITDLIEFCLSQDISAMLMAALKKEAQALKAQIKRLKEKAGSLESAVVGNNSQVISDKRTAKDCLAEMKGVLK